MPRAGSPYGGRYPTQRLKILAAHPSCHRCGDWATEIDHMPPIALNHHVNGSGCCRRAGGASAARAVE